MKSLLVFREKCRMAYGKYEYIFVPVLKFLLAFLSLSVINGQLGYNETISSIPIVVVVALLCSFMPVNLIVVMSFVYILLHAYSLSVAAAIVVAIFALIIFLLYFRFSPKDTVALIGTPVLWVMKVPFVSPVLCGLLYGPSSVISVGTGTMTYYLIKTIKDNEMALSSGEEDSIISQFRLLMDAIIQNREMMVAVASFSITVLLVYMIRRMSVNYAWTIAMVAGAIANCIIMMMGDLIFGTDISLFVMLLGSLLAIACAKVVEFFFFNVDYKRTEYVQFEDDEYYYYVKAVPKNVVAKPEKSVKKVSTTTRQIPVERINKVKSELDANQKVETFEKNSGVKERGYHAGTESMGQSRTASGTRTVSSTRTTTARTTTVQPAKTVTRTTPVKNLDKQTGRAATSSTERRSHVVTGSTTTRTSESAGSVSERRIQTVNRQKNTDGSGKE